MSAMDYPAEGLPDEHEQFQQYNLNGDISVVFTVKDDIEYLPTFLESIRTSENGREIIFAVKYIESLKTEIERLEEGGIE